MPGHHLRKRLFRYTILISLFVTAFVYIFIFIFSIRKNALLYPVLVGCRFFLQGVFNIYLFEWLFRNNSFSGNRNRRVLRYVLGYIFCVMVFACTFPLEQVLFPNPERNWTFIQSLPAMCWQSIINHGIVVMAHNLLILEYERANTALENSKLKAANLESANQLLRQQIHPHFLFNALSMMKSLYREDVSAGEAYLSHLVNFLRASLSDHQQKIARLEDEVQLCNDYIDLQKIRFEEALSVTIDIPDEVLQNGFVPSFSIQSLIENAIKHNEVTAISPLNIRVFFHEGRIITENNLQLRRLVELSTGKGLMNIIERYRIFSADEVIIQQDSETFKVSIKVLYNDAGYK